MSSVTHVNNCIFVRLYCTILDTLISTIYLPDLWDKRLCVRFKTNSVKCLFCMYVKVHAQLHNFAPYVFFYALCERNILCYTKNYIGMKYHDWTHISIDFLRRVSSLVRKIINKNDFLSHKWFNDSVCVKGDFVIVSIWQFPFCYFCLYKSVIK